MKKSNIIFLFIYLFIISCSKNKVYINFNNNLIDTENNKKIKINTKLNRKLSLVYDFVDCYVIVYHNKVVLVNKKDGKIKEKILNNKIVSNVSADEKYLYLTTADNHFYYLTKNELNVDFVHYESFENTIINDLAPIIHKNYLIVLFNNGKIIVFDKLSKKIVIEKHIEKNEIVNKENIIFGEDEIIIKDTVINLK